MIAAFRKYLLTLCLSSAFCAPVVEAKEHENGNCRQALLEKLSGGAAKVVQGCNVTNKLTMWMELLEGPGNYSFEEIARFIRNNPTWPNQTTLRRSAEKAILASTPPKTVIKFFNDFPPLTTGGALAHIEALRELGNDQELLAAVKHAWVERDFSKSKQKDFLKFYGSYLNANDYNDRLERLLWEDQVEQTQRLLPMLKNDRRRMAEARLKFKAGKKAAVPAKFANSEGVLYDQVRSLRKQKRFDEAATLIHQANISTKHAAAWWREIHYIAREYMEEKRFEDAHNLIAQHKLQAGEHYATAEWTMGWLKLRFLDKPAEAAENFKRLFKRVKSPISVGRAAYWSGRAYEALKNPQEAAKWYKKAAEYRTTYYGQLAAAKMRMKPHPELKKHHGDNVMKAKIVKKELVQVLHLLAKFGKRAYGHTRPFVLQLAGHAENDHEKHHLLDYITKLVPHEVVWFARKAGARKHIELTQGYPHLEGVPTHKGMPEAPLSHAIAYQESRFDPHAVSHAGAMGLMQLMPHTAKRVAKKSGIPHKQSRLIDDPKHNVLIGTHNLRHLLEKFDGSYILTIAAYNAGEAPVERWIELFGDPRTSEIDVIDWIELIPYYETRDYVQRVMENLGPYREVLEGEVKQTIIEDLQR